jgi:hypothetical protein
MQGAVWRAALSNLRMVTKHKGGMRECSVAAQGRDGVGVQLQRPAESGTCVCESRRVAQQARLDP